MMDQTQIRTLAVAALLAADTSAGSNVFPNFDLPTFPQPAAIYVYIPGDRKESMGRTIPEFTTVVTLAVVCKLAGTDPGALTTAVDTLRQQVLAAILTNYDLVSGIQQFANVDTRVEYSSDGRQHIAQIQIHFDIEFPELFDPYTQAPAAAQSVAVDLNVIDVNVDLQNVFDPTGTYADPPFPAAVVSAPRTSGPDGRNEGTLSIDLT